MYSIDLDLYEPTDVRANVWSVGMKIRGEDGKDTVLKEPLYQTKVTFRPKKANHIAEMRRLMGEIQAEMPVFNRVETDARLIEYAAELCLFDLHIGKVGVGEQWEIDGAISAWKDAFFSLLDQMPTSQIGKYVLPIGNDFIHFDSSKGMTYGGTPVGWGDNWFKMVLAGKELLCQSIEYLAERGDVIVPVVSGNHDRDTTFSLAEMVAERFRNIPSVKVINTDKMRLYWRFGTNLIGWSHGDTVKFEKLANMMPVECPQDWAATTYRAFHIGHLHQRRRAELNFLVGEHYGVDVEIIPSLAPKDKWHENNGFVGPMRRATAYVYHAEKGLCQQIWHTHGKKSSTDVAIF